MKLVQGDVKIVLNGDESNPVVVAGFNTFIYTFGEKIFCLQLVVAVVCAMCKCRVTDGGGDVLPTEVGHLSRAEQHENVRLACQVKLNKTCKFKYRKKSSELRNGGEVVSNYNVATFIKNSL